jgi:hydrogenase/urease accessory protein HupE
MMNGPARARPSPARLWTALIAVFWALAARGAAAHPPVNALAVVKVTPEGGWSLTLTYDALAFALNDTSQNIPDGPMFELLDGPEDALAEAMGRTKGRFEALCRLAVDGAEVPVVVAAAPTGHDVKAWREKRRGMALPVKLDLLARADLPPGGRSFTVRLPEILGPVILAVDLPGQETVAIPLGASETSPPFPLPAAPGSPAAGGASPAAEAPGPWEVLRRFAVLGFRHIVPEGLDHCLFVLGLFLPNPRFRPVLVQVSFFTLAHTLTLTLSSLGIIGLPSWFVEPAIALSIVAVGAENLISRRVDWKRTLVCFAFGLLHGLGVATAFHEEGIPTGRLLPALGAFTAGVEAGHAAVLAAAFAALGWARGRPWYRKRIAIPLSLAIAGVAAAWFVQRI